MTPNRRSLLQGACALALAPLACLPVLAQDFPNKGMKIIYTYAPGGTGDALARALATQLGTALGQSVVVENRTGASGTIGVVAGMRAPADGYTTMLTTITTVVQTPMIIKDPSFDPVKALQPIANISVTPLVLLAHPSVPVSDFPSFVEWARKQPTGVDVAVSGPTLEVATALLAKGTGVKFVNINYRGMAPALQALLAGEVKLFFITPSGAMMEFIKQGKVKVLGVTSDGPTPLIPGGVPINKYLPGYVQDINFALWAAPGTPAPVVNKLSEAVRKIVSQPAFGELLHNMGTTAAPGGPDMVVSITEREAANIKRAMEIATIKYE